MILATPPPFLPLPSADSLPAPDGDVSTAAQVARSYLGRIRAEVRQRHDAGAGGLAVVAAYTEAIDRLVRYLYDNATAHYLARNPRIEPRCAVIAQGGYGRGELNPYSDIDLLFLYPWKISPYVETVAEVMLYALWDAGLQCGHALRNMRECGRLAARDLKVKTALLDSRFLCGDEPLYTEFEKVVFEELWSQSQTSFFKEKLAENVSRHARAGDSVYLLQPQLKEGQGGLRDLHTALWMANVKFKVRTMRALVARGVLAEADFTELERAVDFVWRVRNALHLATDSHQDQLTFDLQERLAPALGFGEGRAGSEAFMRTYFQHATTINRVSEAIIARCVQQPAPYHGSPPRVRRIRDGMRIQGRTLAVSGPEVFTASPAALVLVFTEAQRHGATLSPPTRDLIREAAPAARARERVARRRGGIPRDRARQGAHLRDARRDAQARRPQADRAGVRPPRVSDRARPVPHLHGGSPFADGRAGARTAAHRRVRPHAAAPHPGGAGAAAVRAPGPGHALPRHRQGRGPRSRQPRGGDGAGHLHPARAERGRDRVGASSSPSITC